VHLSQTSGTPQESDEHRVILLVGEETDSIQIVALVIAAAPSIEAAAGRSVRDLELCHPGASTCASRP
jgi:hypothetical protein